MSTKSDEKTMLVVDSVKNILGTTLIEARMIQAFTVGLKKYKGSIPVGLISPYQSARSCCHEDEKGVFHFSAILARSNLPVGQQKELEGLLNNDELFMCIVNHCLAKTKDLADKRLGSGVVGTATTDFAKNHFVCYPSKHNPKSLLIGLQIFTLAFDEKNTCGRPRPAGLKI
ncbi:MAG: hypothetical protein WCF94_02620 [bacterium]